MEPAEVVNQPPKSILKKRSNPSNQNGLFGFISQEQILDDIMMIARRHDEEEKSRREAQIAEERRRRVLEEKFRRNLEQQNPERQRAPYSLSGGLFAGQTIRPDPLMAAHSSNVNEAPTLIFSSMPTLAPVRKPPQKVKPQEPS